MRLSFLPAHSHLIFTCSCASHFTCSCASHFGLRMRISFTLAHAHFYLACACASYFGLHMKTWRRTCSWCCKNSLLISADKTKILNFGVPQLLRRVPSVAISILGKEITPVPVARDLGVFIDQYLTYDNT